MARINDGTFRDWKNGDTISSDGYEQDREIIRVAINASDDKIKAHDDLLSKADTGLAPRVETLEGTVDMHGQSLGELSVKVEGDHEQRISDAEQNIYNIEQGNIPTIVNRLNGVDDKNTEQDTRLNVVEGDVYSTLVPVTFAQLQNQNLTFEDFKLGYVDSQMKTKDRGFDITWNALLALDGDWTNAIQTALNNNVHVYIPPGTFPFTALTVTKFGAVISGDGQTYSTSILEYRGSGKAITVKGTVGYAKFNNFLLKGIPTVSTDYYNTGSIGVDLTDGYTSIVMKEMWLQGFEILVNSNYNSYYNKFIDGRYEKAKICFNNFSVNNIEFKGNRFSRFHKAIVANGGNGVLTIEKNSFEIFNAEIVQTTGAEKGITIFKHNYVEMYDGAALPTNFPNMEASGAKPGYFGGNTLFTGNYGVMILMHNELQIGGVFRLVTLNTCDHFRSEGNNIHITGTNDNLDRLYGLPVMKTYYIKDFRGHNINSNIYNRVYNPVPLSVSNVHNEHYYYDCILDKEILDSKDVFVPTILNGWTAPDANHGIPKIHITQKGMHLQGLVTGTARTDVVLMNIPADRRPLSNGTSKLYCNLTAFSNYGGGTAVRLRYIYSSGDLRYELGNDVANVVLDGLFIPMQT